MSPSKFFGFALAMALAQGAASASVFTATDNSASVTITSSTNGGNTDLTIVLTNLTPATTTNYGAVNLLTGLSLTGVDITTFSLKSQTAAQKVDVSNATPALVTFDNPPPFDPSWTIDASKGLYFGGFGNGGIPIISQAVNDSDYPDPGSSLVSGPHGTYIYESATYVIEKAGTVNLSDITGVTFLFNTNGNTKVTGNPGTGTPPSPEPTSLALLGLGAVGLVARRRAR